MNTWLVNCRAVLCSLLVVGCSTKEAIAPGASAPMERPETQQPNPVAAEPTSQQIQPSAVDKAPQADGQNGQALELPAPAATKQVRWLEQGWTRAMRQRMHHTTQGSATFPVPYEWFVALEQPSATPEIESPLFIESEYTSRFGLIRGETDPKLNPLGLPVGFAQAAPFADPIPGGLNPNPATGQPYTAIGFTCAACHTGQLEYKETRLLIDGGPATMDLGMLGDALRAALAGLSAPARAQRFIQRVLPPGPKPAQVGGLRAQLAGFKAAAKREVEATVAAVKARVAAGDVPVKEGFSRLDALGRIGNQIFWVQQRRANKVRGTELNRNYALTNAPVNYPHIWDAPWFDWVQYNGSVMQPMFRNFSESLGVGATVNLGPDPATALHSSVPVESLYKLEQDLAGPPPFKKKAFQGLRSPAWPQDVLGAIDVGMAKKGERLYAKRCQGCHLPSPASPEFWSTKYWKKDAGAGKADPRYLVLKLTPIDKLGTDPAQAENLRKRKIQLPEALGGKVVSYAAALASLSAAIDKAYEQAEVPAAKHEELNGKRPNLLRAELAYRPRPLNGVWATPPFLHNASVPTLYQLLSPQADRPTTFFLGSREFDPKHVGLNYDAGPGLFEVDTSLPGNRNTGHEFAKGKGKGIIGPELSPDERLALIEYVKTL